MLDAEAFRLFEDKVDARAQTYNATIGSLVGHMATEAESLSAQIQGLTGALGIPESELYLNDDLYVAVANQSASSLLGLLGSNEISGAFLMLGGSNANKTNDNAHSLVYVRNSSSRNASGTGNYLLEMGPISFSQRHKLPTSINWRLDLELPDDSASTAYYHKVIEAVANDPRQEIERYGYWSVPVDILGDRQQVITYTLPLIGQDGEAFGVLGAEISLSLITQSYLPQMELPYQNSFYSISSADEEAIHLDWYIPSGSIAQVYLKQGEALPLKTVPTTILYETQITGLGEMYVHIEPLTMYSRNSPFYEDSWYLVGYVPKTILHETSSVVRTTLISSIGLTTVASFAAILVLVYFTTRKISGLSKHVRSMSPYSDIHFTRTGIGEIDELMNAVEKLNQSVINAAKTTSKYLELTQMPLGGYEVSSQMNYVTVTEYVYSLLGLAPGTEISKEEWTQIHLKLVEKPAQGYDNVYNYTDYLKEERWLRIVEASTETGLVGVVQDVSRDVEERRRLAHELDYDALTHLYSRTAFKREAFDAIKQRPQMYGAMIFIDLDNLKYMNDTFGHEMGDRLIIRAGEMLSTFQEENGIISRISGDEFAVYIHGFESIEKLRATVHRLLETRSNYFVRTPDGQEQRIRFSAGIAFYPTDSMDVTDLLKLSDYAMYEAKHNKKGAIFEFNKDSYRENVYLLENREAINLLLDEGLIRFAFQPIVDVRSGEIYAYEALMRPLLDNFKSPLEILSVAAAQSKLAQLEALVLKTAFQAMRERQEQLAGRKLFINSIPSQLISDEEHLMLERNYSDLFPQVVMEITEAENDVSSLLDKKLKFLREHQMQVAIDDFGSGYSNEGRLLSLAPDIIKIDMSMVSGIDEDPDKQTLVSNLIGFCHSKNIQVVAEGVERREEMARLIWLGVDFLQGYYLGRPAFDLEPLPDRLREEIEGVKG